MSSSSWCSTTCSSTAAPQPPYPNTCEEEQLCLYFGKVRVPLDDKQENPKPAANLSPSKTTTTTTTTTNVSPTKTLQTQFDLYPKPETRLEKPTPVAVPLYSQTQSIWGVDSLNGAGNFVGSNNVNVHDNVHQQKNLVRNLGPTSQSMSNPFGKNMYQGSGGIYSNGGWYQSSSAMGNLSSFNNDGCRGDQTFKRQSYADIARFAMTQLGSQWLLETMVDLKDPLAKNMIFTGVFESMFEVMNDSHGYYVFGKLLESCSYNQLRLVVQKLISSPEVLINTSINKYGSKSIQRLINVLEKSPLIYTLTSALSGVLEQLMTNRTGSFVILKCLNLLDTEKNEKIYEAAVSRCIALAQHEKGCIYLNEFITYSKTPYREKLMDEISSRSKFLSQDPSGNFVLQHVLGLHNPVFSAKICFELRNLYIQLCSQKGGSHVVEGCLNSSGMDYVVNAFLKYDKLWQIARDQFGNYVIQTALKVTKRANSPLHQQLLAKLTQHRSELEYGFGKRVLNLIDKGITLD